MSDQIMTEDIGTADELDTLSRDIDEAVVDVFSTLKELFSAREKLESVMKDGFLNMAKARYEMGQSSAVSSLQYCEQDLITALYHVHVSDDGHTSSDCPSRFEAVEDSLKSLCSSLHFLPLQDNNSHSKSSNTSKSPISKTSHDDQDQAEEGIKCHHSTDASADLGGTATDSSKSADDSSKGVDISELGVGVRRRRGADEKSVQGSPDSDDTSSDRAKLNDSESDTIETASKEHKKSNKNAASKECIRNKSQQSTGETNGFSEDGATPWKDPLRWFGVLVPRTLRASQSSFKQAVEISCEVATLQSRLHGQRERVVELIKKKKNEMGKNLDKNVQNEDVVEKNVKLNTVSSTA